MSIKPLNEIKTTNTLLLIIVVPLVFYLLKILSFIFIPLFFSVFIAFLFLPLMRWFNRKKVARSISLILIFIIILGIFKIGIELIQLSSREILSANNNFFRNAQSEVIELIRSLEEIFGVQILHGEDLMGEVVQKENSFKSVGTVLGLLSRTISMTLMTIFFAMLWLAESDKLPRLFNDFLFRKKDISEKAFNEIEKDLVTFIKVKFILSLLTGISTSLVCIFFNVSFPIFWGLFAFVVNFVQMIGSFATMILLTLFAFIEIDNSGTLLFFILSIVSVQVLYGSILEPIFMGRSFSINVITVLITLMLWGYIWGVPGLILAIPITVTAKIILEQFPNTQMIARLISGSRKSPIKVRKKRVT